VDIKQATEGYEAWLRASLPVVVEADLEYKHQRMAAAVFPFLRATFYRWAERWPELCPDLAGAPPVLGVGDLHVENYGTWRDTEGRLVWGINDFDEATYLPYAVDLVRLATSAALAAGERNLSLPPKEAALAILTGYQEGLAQGGGPFVLAERHSRLRRMASGELRDPVRFWTKMQALPQAARAAYPPDAVDTVVAALPDHRAVDDVSIRSRRAGLGSLGRPRLVALTTWQGGAVAREVKAVLPSAWDQARGVADETVHYAEVVGHAVRCPDPCSKVRDRWLVRRLAPDCTRIEMAELPALRDETALLHSMGFEAANIHLGTPGAGSQVLDDLTARGQQDPRWLVSAAQRMAAETEADWRAWRG
jgi:uncharacterized protein (DUF2252 family)